MSGLTIGSLFSGIGGLELGLERGIGEGCQTVWQAERDPFCLKVLAKHWSDTERFDDIRAVGTHNLKSVEVICGGFPCQDVSLAGLRGGMAVGTRSGLWHEYARVICELRPRYVVVENVAGLLSDGMGVVLGELSSLGYDAEWSVVQACSVGASHPRARVFILAHADSIGLQGGLSPRTRFGVQALPKATVRWDVSPPFVCRGSDGIPNRAHRLRALGNAVVP